MSMNGHNFLHLRRSVEQLGPLWANSSFEFESANGKLKSLFHGSQNIDIQVRLWIVLYSFDLLPMTSTNNSFLTDIF